MKVALFQFDIAWENKNRNFKKVKSLIERIDENIDLIVLPELFSTGYTMNSAALAEDLQGETISFLSEIARQYKVNVLGSFIEKTSQKPKNSAMLINKNGDKILHYSKIHLFSFVGEDKNYTPGDKILACELDNHKIGVAICYDLRFPELFRKLVDKDVKCVFVIASWPNERIYHWNNLLVARAIENQMYVVGLNRIGSSPLGNYSGHSKIINPLGNVVNYGIENEESVIIGDIDFLMVDMVRSNFPALNDRKLLD